MSQLSPARLLSRLVLDYRVMCGLNSDSLGPIRAFISRGDMLAGIEATKEDGEAGRGRLYKVEYRLPILIGPGQTRQTVTVVFDLLAGGNYPFSAPTAMCFGTPFPWSPHVHPASGTICLGEGWTGARGQVLAAHLVVHVMRLFNCDEPDREHYGGWNPAAIHYWRTVLGRRPLNPDLRYPVLPADITHAVDDNSSVFRSAGEVSVVNVPPGLFEALLPDEIFQPLAGDTDAGEFQPLGR